MHVVSSLLPGPLQKQLELERKQKMEEHKAHWDAHHDIVWMQVFVRQALLASEKAKMQKQIEVLLALVYPP